MSAPSAPSAPPAPGPPPFPDMAWVPGGAFLMGSDGHYPEEAPAHRAEVGGCWVDRHPVTVAQYRRFVKATGYVTVAERAPRAEDYPGAKPEMLVPGSVVFRQPPGRVALDDHHAWWAWVPGAEWRRPEGLGSTVAGRDRHPVTHVAYADAAAYAAWAGKALPTEAEWEFACRGGLEGAEFAWGDEFAPRDRPMANTWQGEFPWQNLESDGWARTSPVGSYPPNGYGLYDTVGNVWEWTTDPYRAGHRPPNGCCGGGEVRPPGDGAAGIAERAGAPIPEGVIKGGSHLCAPNYCRRYRPAARMRHPVDTGTSHIGFRCVVRPAGGGPTD